MTSIMTIPEIQECLSEIENRLSYIENSMPYSNGNGLSGRLTELEERVSLLRQPQMRMIVHLTAKQNDTINQIKLGYNHLIGKVDEALARKKGKQYKKYK